MHARTRRLAYQEDPRLRRTSDDWPRSKRQFGGAELARYERDVMPLMAVLVAARESLPLELLRRATALTERVFKRTMREVVAFCGE